MKRNILFLKNNFTIFLGVVLVFLIQQTAMGQIQSLASTTPVCLGDPSTITVSSNSFLANVSYTVTYSLSGANTAANISIGMSGTSAGTRTFTVPSSSLISSGTTTVTITQISNGIFPDVIGANNTVGITVNPILTPTVSIVASPSSSICAGTSVTFTATGASTGGGTVNYNFKR